MGVVAFQGHVASDELPPFNYVSLCLMYSVHQLIIRQPSVHSRGQRGSAGGGVRGDLVYQIHFPLRREENVLPNFRNNKTVGRPQTCLVAVTARRPPLFDNKLILEFRFYVLRAGPARRRECSTLL
ncbi:hypothetical protein EVAR_38621_1 [Eumeta japonica]|uniref:Uncharacterized protein n=1 Tax=Eumeta variegata TaxID=151549 RepID=A0A4C1WU17_EUMVA|nr:hypothetical protein EVAR_38621_1 [Eumeta japonica]